MRILEASFLVSSTLLATVLSAQSPLAIVNNSFPTGAVGQVYAQALGATGGIQPYVWSATGQIPPVCRSTPSAPSPALPPPAEPMLSR